MTATVLPGQPLSVASTSASLLAGPGTFARGGAIYSSLIGEVSRDGGVSSPLLLHQPGLTNLVCAQVISVKGKEDAQAIPEPNSIVRPAPAPDLAVTVSLTLRQRSLERSPASPARPRRSRSSPSTGGRAAQTLRA